jgi:ElaB/YqjD/DUF883 family membrane-anchored ribosome-binding protein
METTTPNIAAKVETSTLTKPLSAAPVESTQATSRFPTRARHPGSEEQATAETKIEDFFSSQNWTESARDAVRAHPLAVVGVALVAGLIVGRL